MIPPCRLVGRKIDRIECDRVEKIGKGVIVADANPNGLYSIGGDIRAE